ncbi:hypothetical protein ANSO36C_10120 [Nostoc cf. commune SO-36]|uniref:Transposase n=1 Tax=Nostoc cf. commune SO-36 TaxID=449208 RepID=A0ABM7YX49_NOSCO|nr:hypothetical protein [Nostoc commune]BDI15210.1 hypothetical protein ANSO36C_10120 [Nostoc cf. commune SO-36]
MIRVIDTLSAVRACVSLWEKRLRFLVHGRALKSTILSAILKPEARLYNQASSLI